MKPRGSKDSRPVNLDISTIKLPITAWASISHRVTGSVAVRIKPTHGLGVGYESLVARELRCAGDNTELFGGESCLMGLFGGVFVSRSAGIRHLIMDMGVGEDFKGGALGARILFGAAAVAAVVWGVVLW